MEILEYWWQGDCPELKVFAMSEDDWYNVQRLYTGAIALADVKEVEHALDAIMSIFSFIIYLDWFISFVTKGLYFKNKRVSFEILSKACSVEVNYYWSVDGGGWWYWLKKKVISVF